MRVKMYPALSNKGVSGIDRVVEAYHKHLPQFDVQIVDIEEHNFDLIAGHVGQGFMPGIPFVCHTHGLYWTADYSCDRWQWKVNADVINAIRHADEVTVPSPWVAEPFQRDMRFTPHIVPHGIDWQEWTHNLPNLGYVLWNKNRAGDVCDPMPVARLAQRFSNQAFVTTYVPKHTPQQSNVDVIGTIPHARMKTYVQQAAVYLSTTKETFGIGVLEAMASGVPVLGYKYGGNVDLVQHGVNGYLAEPGNLEDLCEGLDYCLRNRATLGVNGRELVKRWTWESACEKVAQVYRQALEPRPATVAVIIPVYNKTEEQLERAIDSVRVQTFNGLEQIIIVDDGTPDRDYRECVTNYSRLDDRVRLVRISNSGVATARNMGIRETNTKYVCCLDSDDAIEANFIETCVTELEEDRSLGIAYTALRWIDENGNTEVSKWPSDFDFDRQLKKQNQVPTCCVFRRKMWERLGGYNPKYAPGGAGAEDAELWLRAGAYGWGAKQVTKEPLFVYSFGGQVSGNKSYVEPDWTALHPWTKDGLHPFASVATPRLFSHPVRQYDEPVVSVIIPVGPGHGRHVKGALESLEAQTFREWEVVVVSDTDENVYNELRSYPYVRFVPGGNKRGPGYARNRGAEIARAPFLFFLDADDRLLGTDALQKHLDAWQDNQAIVYADYVGKAIVSDVSKLDQSLQRSIYERNERTGETILGYKNRKDADFDCERAQSQPQNLPYIWCNVTVLIPKAWHQEIGGFDESLTSWEDVDYHWRLAKAGKCYHRIPEELMIYQFHTGQRREYGRQAYQNLLQYLREKHERIEIMPCSGCGSNRRTNKVTSTTTRSQPAQQLNDVDFVEVLYNHPNKGRHQVTGGFVFDRRLDGVRMRSRGPGRWSIDYGQRAGGERFLVHRADMQSQSHLFVPAPPAVQHTAPAVQKAPLPDPEPLVNNLEIVSSEEKAEVLVAEPTFDLQMLPGVGPELAKQLEDSGVKTRSDFERLGVDGLRKFKGISDTKAQVIMRVIQSMKTQ